MTVEPETSEATSPTEPPGPLESPPASGSITWPLVGIVVWLGVIAAAVVWPRLQTLPQESGVNAPPFYGRWELHDVVGVVPAVVVAVALVIAWPRVTDAMSTWVLAGLSGVASVGWALILAVSAGTDAITSPFANKRDYLDIAPDLDASTFVRTYLDRLGHYPTHLKSHPPGMPLVLRALRTIGLGGAEGAAVATFVLWAAGIAAVLLVVAELGGVEIARRASGAVAFLPAVVFVASSYDAFFAGAMAVAIATLVFAARRTGLGSDVGAVVGGALMAGCLHLSYGLAPLELAAGVIMVSERRVRPVLLAAMGFGAVFVGFVAGGFWWFDGLEATRGFYHEGISRFRPYNYFVFVGNPAALALSVGPVTAAGFATLARRGPRALWSSRWALPALAALAAVAAADLTGLSNAETERIWLPFMPWLTVAGAAVCAGRGRRWWLVASLAIGVVLQVTLVTAW